MIPFNKFMYLWPPRPETAIQFGSSQFKSLASNDKWVAQAKMNGQRNTIYVDPSGNIEMWNRHKEKHRNYKLSKELSDQILSAFPNNGEWLVLDGELLHNKGPHVKNTIYIWDVLVHNSKLLVGTEYLMRYVLLSSMNRAISEDDIAIKVTDNIWMPRNIFPIEYDRIWKNYVEKISYVEGFMLKNLRSLLEPMVVQKNNSGWQVRCRKQSKICKF